MRRRDAIETLIAIPSIALTSLALPLLTPREASAYILPTPYVLKKAAARLAATPGHTITYEGTGRLREPTPGAEDMAVTERWTLPAHRVGGPRAELRAGEHRATLAIAGNAANAKAEGTGDVPMPPVPQWVVFTYLFFQADPSGLIDRIGARRDAQHLDLIGERPMHVLGAPAGDREAPAMWIDHETFEVRRVRFEPAEGPCDIRLDEWQGPITRGLFPQRYSVRLGGQPVRAMRATAADAIPGGTGKASKKTPGKAPK